MVLDTNTGTLISAAPVGGGGNPAEASFNFAYLPAGVHKLEFIEPFRDEYFEPDSKIVTVDVPSRGSATTQFNLVRNWRFSEVANFPNATGRTYFGGLSCDFLNSQDGWCALEQDVTLPPYPPGYQDVFIYQTTNGGTSWTKVSTITTPYVNDDLQNDSFNPLEYGLHFTDPMHGVLIGEESSPAVVQGYLHLDIFTTSDGGKTWNEETNHINLYGLDAGTDGVYPLVSLGWDPSNPENGTIFGSLGVTGNGALYTYTTSDGGVNWTAGPPYAEVHDLYYSFFQRLFVFGGNNFSAMTTGYVAGFPVSDSLLYSGIPDWVPLTDPSGMDIYADGHTPYNTETAFGNRAAEKMDESGTTKLYQTNDAGATWSQVMHPFQLPTSVFLTGSNLSFQAQEASTVNGGTWLWDPDQNGGTEGSQVGRSVDNLVSRSFMGYCISGFPVGSIEQVGTQVDASTDIYHGRKMFMMDPGFNANGITGGTDWLLNFYFNDQSGGSAELLPKVIQSSTGDFGNTKILLLQFVNEGTQYAKNITINSITATHGVTFQATFPLKYGSIPPLSATDIPVGSYITYPPPSYVVESTIPPAGTRFSITITGTYNNRQGFRQTIWVRS